MMKTAVLAVCLFALAIATTTDVEDMKSYKGYSVLRTVPKDVASLKLLKSLQAGGLWGIDWHRQPSLVGYEVDMQVSPEHLPALKAMLTNANIEYSVFIEDLQTLIDNQHETDEVEEEEEEGTLSEMKYHRSKIPHLSHFHYHKYAKIAKYLDTVCSSKTQPCETINIGKSHEGRDLKVIKIGTDGASKSIVWIDAGIHAREWIAPASALFIIDRLVRKSCESDLLLEKYVFYIMPSMNPDGYEFTHTKNRMWRKTRTPNKGSSCVGTDPNRNWNFHFGGAGTSSDPCSETYHGSHAFSEPCTHAAAVFMKNLSSGGKMNVYLSLHSYSQLWLLPWGYTYELPSNYKEMEAVALRAANNQKHISGLSYKVGSVSRILYKVTGASQEWAKGVLKTRFAYTVELPDTGAHGFVLPARMIKPTARGMHSALKTMLREISKRT